MTEWQPHHFTSTQGCPSYCNINQDLSYQKTPASVRILAHTSIYIIDIKTIFTLSAFCPRGILCHLCDVPRGTCPEIAFAYKIIFL